MNVFDLILWFLIYGNQLLAQGYIYDLRTSQFRAPAAVSQQQSTVKASYSRDGQARTFGE